MRRPGYSLMEVMCVMVIIVIAAALTIPAIQSMLADTRVSAAGDNLRGRIADARANAMSGGTPWRLAFLPNTGMFQLAPEDSSDWQNAAQDETEQPDLIRGQLPTGVVMSLNQDDIMNNPQAMPGGGNWETIAIFEPQGCARDDITVYFGKPGLGPNRIKVRGLTGVVSVEIFNILPDQQP